LRERERESGTSGDMVDHVPSSPSKPVESSRVRKERDEENAAVETPSKKRKHSIAGAIVQGNGEDGNNAEEEVAGIVSDGNAPSHAPAVTPEAVASLPEAPAREVYRIPSYAGM